MIKRYILTEAEIEKIRDNVEQIYNRLEQLELEEREIDHFESLAFREKLNSILKIID